MIRFLTIIFLTLFLFSCDPGYRADIINHSDKPTNLVFEYDKVAMQRNLDRKVSFVPSLIYDNETSQTEFKIDSINFIVSAKIKPNDTLNIEMGIGTHPDFKNIDRIIIYTSDTLKLDTKEKMLSAFDKKPKNYYELILK